MREGLWFVGETSCYVIVFFFFFNDTATTEIYTLSLHDALPILLVDQICLRPLNIMGVNTCILTE